MFERLKWLLIPCGSLAVVAWAVLWVTNQALVFLGMVQANHMGTKWGLVAFLVLWLAFLVFAAVITSIPYQHNRHGLRDS